MKSKLTIEDVLERTGWTKELEARGEARGEVRGKQSLASEFTKLIDSVSNLQELKSKFKKMKIA
ncbi:hypothetical protein AGMMS49938_00150 [Fibrobacterales bacterium]|nr:hypothetical protein AGMMS49938_00150 [Fibrobacterales bacterium]